MRNQHPSTISYLHRRSCIVDARPRAVRSDCQPCGEHVSRAQAQTVANFYAAFELDLAIIPVINKIDLPAADPDRVAAEIESAFDLPADTNIRCSAKAGVGIDEVLRAVVRDVPPPGGDESAPFRLLLFDAHTDEFRGVVCLVVVKDGVVRKGDRLRTHSTGNTLDVLEVWSFFHPFQDLELC